MFGYVVPDKNIIKDEQFALYGAFFCGLCKLLGEKYGQMRRLATNYDITFFAAFAHDQLNQPVEFAEERCVGSPVQKRAVIKPNPLMERIAALNIIFSFYKAEDNVIDGGGAGAAAVKKLLSKSFLKAAAAEPKLDGIVKEGYAALRVLEKANESSIDRVADCFASLLRGCGSEILGECATDSALRMIYNVGKFVYLADALDDITDDAKKKRYNPLLAALGECKGRVKFIQTHKEQLTFVFAVTVNRAIECFNGIEFNQSYSLIQNIIYYGLRKKTDELLGSKRKLKRPRIM